MAQYQGPIKPGTSGSVFRGWGKSIGVPDTTVSTPAKYSYVSGGGGGSPAPEPAPNFQTVKGENVFVPQQSDKPATAKPSFIPQQTTEKPSFLQERFRPSVSSQDNLDFYYKKTPYGYIPRGEVQPAEDVSGYGKFIKNKNPVTATMEFGAEKFQGLFGKTETRGQSIAETGLISKSITTAPYFIPATAPAFLLGAGLGQFTPGGRAETKSIAQEFKQEFGVPETATKIGVYGLAGTGAVFGGIGLTRQAESALGLPKFETKFISQSVPLKEDASISKTAAFTTRKGLVSDKQFISAMQSKTQVRAIEDNLVFRNIGLGATREIKGTDIITGRNIFGKPKPFGSLSEGLAIKTEQEISMPVSKGISVSKNVEGFDVFQSSNVFTKKGSKQFFGLGKTYSLNEETAVSKGLSFPASRDTWSNALNLQRKGRIESFGISKLQPADYDSGFSLIVKGSAPTKSIQEQFIKQSIAQSLSPAPSKVLKPIRGSLGSSIALKPKLISTQKMPPISLQSQIGIQTDIQKDFQKLNLNVGLYQPEKTRQRYVLDSTVSPALDFKEIQKPMQKPLLDFGFKTALREKQAVRNIFKTPTTSRHFDIFPPISPGGFGFPFAFPKIGMEEGKKGYVKTSRKYKRTPSFVAADLGLYASKPSKYEITGLSFRPLLSSRKPSGRKRRRFGFVL